MTRVALAWGSLGLRGQYFVLSLAVLVVSGAVAATWVQGQVTEAAVARIEEDLERLARIFVHSLGADQTATLMAQRVTAVTSTLQQDKGLRVTLIGADGTVVADTGITDERLGALDNHNTRPEIKDARLHGRGLVRRESHTLGRSMLYIARPAAGGVVVRVGLPLDSVEVVRADLRHFFVASGVVFLALAILGAALTSSVMQARLRPLLARARAIPRSASSTLHDPRGDGEERDDVDRLARTFNDLALGLDRAVLALARDRDRFDAVLSAMDEGVVAIDGRGRIVVMNPAAKRLLRLPENAQGEFVSSLDGTTPEAVRAVYDEALAGRSATRDIVTPQHKGGPQVQLRGATSDAGVVVLVATDVTEIRRLETLRRDFVANVSHELRTPCSVILANSETLLGDDALIPAQAQRFVEAIQRNAVRLSRLIADLLELSKIEAGSITLATEPVRINDVIHSVVSTLEPQAVAKRITMTTALAPGLTIVGDPKALDQILMNLIDNAVKYTPAGGNVTVSSAALEDGGVRLSVIDDGPGVDARHKERLFERFYRVDAGRSREVGGTGLGLAIVKHLVEALAGRVTVADAVPHGTCFQVDMPGPSLQTSLAKHDIGAVPNTPRTDSQLPPSSRDTGV